MLNVKTQKRLVIALALAESEIHNPGAARARGLDIVALIEGVLAEADPKGLALHAVREDMLKTHSSRAA